MNPVRAGFAERFQQALKEAGYGDSQLKELAGLFGVSSQAVRKWLSAESLPGSARSPEIAAILGVRRAWLLDGEKPMRAMQVGISETGGSYRSAEGQHLAITQDEFRLLKQYRSLPRKLQASVADMLENLGKEIGKKRKKKNKK